MGGNFVRAALAAALLLTAGPSLAAGAPRPSFTSDDFTAVAPDARLGERFEITGVEVLAASGTLTFEVERFEVFAPDARIVVHEPDGERILPRPANVYFKGTVAGEPGSAVFLDVLPGGRTRGILARSGETYVIETGVETGRLVAEPADLTQLKAGGEPWKCAQEELAGPPSPPEPSARLSPKPEKLGAAGGSSGLVKSFLQTARVAIETDYELLHLPVFGGNTTAVTDYIGDLIGYSSTIYENQIQTNLSVSSVSLWDVANAGADPWVYTDTTCALMDFGRYWNLNNGAVSRTIAHFLSGKNVNAGVAWVGVLCSGAFVSSFIPTCVPALPAQGTPWGGGYGYTSGIDGNFDPNNPQVIWDIYSVSHEIGHNFNSPHTHCYNGIGNPSPVDQCYAGEAGIGCYAGATSLPGAAGAGSGTIMSYCHLLAPGLSNISLKFGYGHAFGVQPERVPARMSAHVSAIAGGNPACLAPVGLIFAGDFENGSLPAPWGAVSP